MRIEASSRSAAAHRHAVSVYKIVHYRDELSFSSIAARGRRRLLEQFNRFLVVYVRRRFWCRVTIRRNFVHIEYQHYLSPHTRYFVNGH